MSEMSDDTEQGQLAAQQLCVGKYIVAFEYAAGFVVRLEAHERSPGPRHVLMYWSAEVRAPSTPAPIEVRGALRVDPFVPPVAFQLAIAIGAKVDAVEIAVDGTLTLKTSDSDVFEVRGVDENVEYSWSLLPDAATEDWSIVCDNNGHIYVRPWKASEADIR